MKKKFKKREESQKWLEIGVSVRGKGHIDEGTPCQDAFKTGVLSRKWRMAVVCDGAGSYVNSHIGARFVARNSIRVFRGLLKGNESLKGNQLPEQEEWRRLALEGLTLIFTKLKVFAEIRNLEIRSLGCTVNLVVYSKHGMLSVHVGDGRAAVKYSTGQWEPVFKPFKGDEAGSTTFLTSDFTWIQPDLAIETKVINKAISAFSLITDGLEQYCFYCNLKDEETGTFFDPNKPFEPFFEKNIEAIVDLHLQGRSKMEIQKLLIHYLEEGHAEISNEYDDKTIVLATLLN